MTNLYIKRKNKFRLIAIAILTVVAAVGVTESPASAATSSDTSDVVCRGEIDLTSYVIVLENELYRHIQDLDYEGCDYFFASWRYLNVEQWQPYEEMAKCTGVDSNVGWSKACDLVKALSIKDLNNKNCVTSWTPYDPYNWLPPKVREPRSKCRIFVSEVLWA